MVEYKIINVDTGRTMVVFRHPEIRKAVDEVLEEVVGKTPLDGTWQTIENFNILIETLVDEVEAINGRLKSEEKQSLYNLDPTAMDKIIGREGTLIRLTSMVAYPNPALEILMILTVFEESLYTDMSPDRNWDVTYHIKPSHHLAIKKVVK